MKFKNVLLLYKRSAYKIYFEDARSSIRRKRNEVVKSEKMRFKESHEDHYITLQEVGRVLLTNGVRYTEYYRGRNIPYEGYDLIITVGGDGTFLEAARKVKSQVIIGVNSAPNHSVGRFCIATKKSFEKVFQNIISNKYSIDSYERLRLKVDGHVAVEAVNEILVCHTNPAMLSRYYLEIQGVKEEQRSSGVWIATPAGSTGAIGSAGGKKLNPYERNIQYLPRELYQGKHSAYKLKGGILDEGQTLKFTSLMRKGAVFFDGAHHKFPFDYSSSLTIKVSPHPIRTIKVEN